MQNFLEQILKTRVTLGLNVWWNFLFPLSSVLEIHAENISKHRKSQLVPHVWILNMCS